MLFQSAGSKTLRTGIADMRSLFQCRADVSFILFANEVAEFTEMTFFRLSWSGTVTAEMMLRTLKPMFAVVAGNAANSSTLENDMGRYFFCNGGTVTTKFATNGFKGVFPVQESFNLFAFIKC